MSNSSVSMRMPAAKNGAAGPGSHLRQEYESWQALFDAQPAALQRFLESQARQLAEALVTHQGLSQIRFRLPDQIIIETPARGEGVPLPVPAGSREQMAGGLFGQLTRVDIDGVLRQRLSELEQSPDRAISLSAGLLRYAMSMVMVHGLLPSGRSVRYVAAEGEEIPSMPAGDSLEPDSAITAASDAIAEEAGSEQDRGELLVPYVRAARRFYLPQWVAFDEADRLLVNTIQEAEAHVASMQRFLYVLHTAISLAPYIVADETYQHKRYGMLGQLVNQGRALARFQTGEIVRTIRQRAAASDLNRGLGLSLPFFDDQMLQMKTHSFEVIPAGRIMFVPAFVVRAARLEKAKVAQDTRLSPSTRHHLLAELDTLERAFETSAE